jgi:uncharacterized protein YjbI with pentapeptide repeats
MNSERIIEWPDLLGALLMVVGLVGYIDGPFPYHPFWTHLYQEVRSDLVGMGLAVLIIDNANQMIATRQEKRRLILQMGSPDHAFAVEAARQLNQRGWMQDGTLRGAFLDEANLEGIFMSGANLQNARLVDANLQGAYLWGANLQNANLVGANLMSANLQGAKLQNARLQNAKLQNARLDQTSLPATSMGEANRKGASLVRANLEESIMWEAKLQGAYPQTFISLPYFPLQINLPGANLSGANLTRANLGGANLTGANLSGANLQHCLNWTPEQLSTATSLEGAILPEGYTPSV